MLLCYSVSLPYGSMVRNILDCLFDSLTLCASDSRVGCWISDFHWKQSDHKLSDKQDNGNWKEKLPFQY